MPAATAMMTWRMAAIVHDQPRRRRAPREAMAAKIPSRSAPPAAKRSGTSASGPSLSADRRRPHAQEDREHEPRDGLGEQQRPEHADHRHAGVRGGACRRRGGLGGHPRQFRRFVKRPQREAARERRGIGPAEWPPMSRVTRLPARGSDRSRSMAEVETLAWLLDNSIPVPFLGGRRFGADAIIGLVPGFGDLVSAGLGLFVVWRASRMGLPRIVVARMLINSAIDLVVGVIPFAGDAFDLWFKANTRNLGLATTLAGAAGPLDARRVACRSC